MCAIHSNLTSQQLCVLLFHPSLQRDRKDWRGAGGGASTEGRVGRAPYTKMLGAGVSSSFWLSIFHRYLSPSPHVINSLVVGKKREHCASSQRHYVLEDLCERVMCTQLCSPNAIVAHSSPVQLLRITKRPALNPIGDRLPRKFWLHFKLNECDLTTIGKDEFEGNALRGMLGLCC